MRELSSTLKYEFNLFVYFDIVRFTFVTKENIADDLFSSN